MFFLELKQISNFSHFWLLKGESQWVELPKYLCLFSSFCLALCFSSSAICYMIERSRFWLKWGRTCMHNISYHFFSYPCILVMFRYHRQFSVSFFRESTWLLHNNTGDCYFARRRLLVCHIFDLLLFQDEKEQAKKRSLLSVTLLITSLTTLCI
jgi:hypothetical protein